MKLKSLSVVSVAMLILGSFASPGLASEENINDEETIMVTVDVQLPPEATLADVAKATVGEELLEVRFGFQTNTDLITVGVVTHGKQLSEAEFQALVDENLSSWQAEAASGEEKANEMLVSSISQAQRLSASELRVIGATTLVEARISEAEGPIYDAPVAVATACGATWWPQLQQNRSGPVSGKRYNTLIFKWTSARLTNLKCYGGNAFEPDFVTNNYDDKYYLGKTLSSWSSNLPSAYMDTDALDGTAERVYTVGSSNRAGLSATTTYSTHVIMNNGNHSSDTAKVVWQRSTWQSWNLWCIAFGGAANCVFADASKIEHAWDITIPGNWAP